MNSSTMETYCGHVRTPADAIKLFEACRLGLLPRVQRRLSEKERQSIKSGSVFVWDEREAGMRRWTDGKSWSASRVSGSFLTYREMEGKRGGGNFVPAPTRQRVAGKTPDSGRGSDEDADMDGEGPDGYRYKPDGLMKQSFSITTSGGQHLHLISYYARHHANSHELLQPTSDPALRHIVPVKGMYPESTVQEQPQGPAVTRAPMQNTYMSTPQQMVPGPLSQGHPRGPYPYQVSQGYNWPPSPVSTPPYTYQVGGYGSQLQPPPSNSAHASPRQTPQLISQATNFDRQQQSYLDPSLPPPPSHSHQRISVPSPQQQPIYARNPSPQMAQARLVAEQQAQQAQRLAQEQQQHVQQQMLQTPVIDPRITGLGAHQQQSNGHLHSQQTGPTSSPANQELGNQSQSQGQAGNANQGQSQSQNIPSISSIVHNHTPTPTPADDARSNASNGTVSRAGSASPKDGKGKGSGGGPQDIPHAKLGFGGEDVRALRVLDRKFCI